MTDAKPYRHRFPMTIIQHAIWLYHRFPLSYRDVQELLHQRGIQVSHETLACARQLGPRRSGYRATRAHSVVPQDSVELS